MIFDLNTLFSNQQAITADAASTNNLNTGTNGTVYGASSALRRDQGKGTFAPLLIQVTETFNNLTSLEVQVRVDDNSAMSSPKIVARTGQIPLASLVAGYQVFIDSLPLGTDEQFIDLFYDITGTAPTLGKVMAGLTMGNQTAPL
jgi:hypothetical protein